MLALPGAATGKSHRDHADRDKAKTAHSGKAAEREGRAHSPAGKHAARSGQAAKGEKAAAKAKAKAKGKGKAKSKSKSKGKSKGKVIRAARKWSAHPRSSSDGHTNAGDTAAGPTRSGRDSDSSGPGRQANRRSGSSGRNREGGRGNNGGGGDRGRGQDSSSSAGQPALPSPLPAVAGASPSVATASATPRGAFDGVSPVGAVPVGVTGAGGASAGPGERAVGRPDRPAARPAPPGSSPIVRTVKQVVEVIPAVVWLLVAALAALTLVGGAGSWLLAARQRRLERQREALLEDVGVLQRALLPPAPEQIAGVATSVAYRPAPGRGAGGDFYDVFALDGERLGVMIGDVSCGGRRGLGLTAIVRHTLRAYLEAGMTPRAALQVASRALEHQLGGDEARVTAGVYDRESGVLTFASAGHLPPVVVGAAAFEPVTACASPPLGCGRRTGLRQTAVALPPGSLVCLYTDGLIEARVGGELFGYRRLSLAMTGLGGRADAGSLVERVASEADATPDDMAACVLRVAPHMRGVTSPGGVRRLEELELSREDLDGDRPAEFMAACGLPSDRIDDLVAAFRTTGARLGAGVLRVRVGPGMPRAELALNRVDVLAGSAAPAR